MYFPGDCGAPCVSYGGWGRPAYNYYDDLWGCGHTMCGPTYSYCDPWSDRFYRGMEGSMWGTTIGSVLGFAAGALTLNPFLAVAGSAVGAGLGGIGGWLAGSLSGGGRHHHGGWGGWYC